MSSLTELLQELTNDRRSRIAELAAAVLRDMTGDELRELALELSSTPTGDRLRAALMEAYNETD